jgi:hypothetical protein
MKVFQEITQWDMPTPNHIYFMDDAKSKAYAYLPVGKTELFEFKSPLKLDVRGRKFKEVPNIWRFFPREELVLVGETFRVPGSKGAVYTVTNDRGSWACTCPASKWQKGECKHIIRLKSEA